MSADKTQGEPRSEKFLLDTALQNMPHGLCMYEKDGRIILFNDRYARLMGIPPTDLKGLSLLDIFRLRKASGHLKGDPNEEFRPWSPTCGTGAPARKLSKPTRPLDSCFPTARPGRGLGFHCGGRQRMAPGAGPDHSSGASRRIDRSSEPEGVPRATRTGTFPDPPNRRESGGALA